MPSNWEGVYHGILYDLCQCLGVDLEFWMFSYGVVENFVSTKTLHIYLDCDRILYVLHRPMDDNPLPDVSTRDYGPK